MLNYSVAELRFITKYLQISKINYNFAADYSKFINFIKTREIMMKRIAMLMGGQFSVVE